MCGSVIFILDVQTGSVANRLYLFNRAVPLMILSLVQVDKILPFSNILARINVKLRARY